MGGGVSINTIRALQEQLPGFFEMGRQQPVSANDIGGFGIPDSAGSQNSLPTEEQLLMTELQRRQSAQQAKQPSGYSRAAVDKLNAANALEQQQLEAEWDRLNPPIQDKPSLFGF